MQATPPPTLLVLAAGMGNRYGGLKQVDPVGPSGETLLDYSVYDAVQAGFGKVVFVIREEMRSSFAAEVASRFERTVEIGYAVQKGDDLPTPAPGDAAGRSKPWGTGHAVWVARDVIQGDFAVINADDFYGGKTYSALATFFRSNPAAKDAYAMVAFPLRNTLSQHGTVARGICSVGGDGMLRGVEELTQIRAEGKGATNNDPSGAERVLTGDELVSMNCWGLRDSIFDHLGTGLGDFLTRLEGERSNSAEYYLPEAIDALVASGDASVTVLESASQWFGVTYRPDREKVAGELSRLVGEGQYPSPLWG